MYNMSGEWCTPLPLRYSYEYIYACGGGSRIGLGERGRDKLSTGSFLIVHCSLARLFPRPLYLPSPCITSLSPSHAFSLLSASSYRFSIVSIRHFECSSWPSLTVLWQSRFPLSFLFLFLVSSSSGCARFISSSHAFLFLFPLLFILFLLTSPHSCRLSFTFGKIYYISSFPFSFKMILLLWFALLLSSPFRDAGVPCGHDI